VWQKTKIIFSKVYFILGGAADGDLIEACGRKYLISKAATVTMYK